MQALNQFFGRDVDEDDVDDVFQMDDAQQPTIVGNSQWRAARTRDSVHRLTKVGWSIVARHARQSENGVHRAFAQNAPWQIKARYPRLRREGHDLRRWVGSGSVDAVAAFGEGDDRALFGGFVREGSQQHRVRQRLLGNPRSGDELIGHAIAKGDGSRLVEQQCVDVARSFDCWA